MRFRGQPLLSALAALCACRSAAAYVMSRMDPDVTAKLELFEHVLLNDTDWRLVLDQPIIISDANRPPYSHGGDPENDQDGDWNDKVHDPEAREAVRLLDLSVTEVTAATVIQRVLNQFTWLGSHVKYAAYVLSSALACVTYTFVSLRIELLLMREDTRKDPATADRFEQEWAVMAVFLDKLAGTRGDLRLLAVLSVLLTHFMDPDSAYGRHAAHLLTLVKADMDKMIDQHCVRVEANEVYKRLGIKADQSHLKSDDARGDPGCILRAYENTTVAMTAAFDRLNIVTTDLVNWKQILDYQTPKSMHVNFYLKIQDTMKNDEVGRKILAEIFQQVKEEPSNADSGSADSSSTNEGGKEIPIGAGKDIPIKSDKEIPITG